MIRILKNTLLFQRKIFFISYILSVIIGILAGGEFKIIGFAFLCIAPFVHLFTYEIKDENKYYYYYNLGLSKVSLWVSTFIIGLINLLILIMI